MGVSVASVDGLNENETKKLSTLRNGFGIADNNLGNAECDHIWRPSYNEVRECIAKHRLGNPQHFAQTGDELKKLSISDYNNGIKPVKFEKDTVGEEKEMEQVPSPPRKKRRL